MNDDLVNLPAHAIGCLELMLRFGYVIEVDYIGPFGRGMYRITVSLNDVEYIAAMSADRLLPDAIIAAYEIVRGTDKYKEMEKRDIQ